MSGLRKRGGDKQDGLREPLLSAPGGDGAMSAPQPAKPESGWLGVFRAVVSGFIELVARLARRVVHFSAETTLSPALRERLTALWHRTAVPFDPEHATHQAALKQLWVAAWPAVPLPPGALRDERWKEMGWQGVDPATDFRGAGFLALENLLYLSATQPLLFQRLLHKTVGKRATDEYPFAVAGLNLTFALIKALDLGPPPPPKPGSRSAAVGSAKSRAPPSTPAGRAFLQLLESDPAAFDELYLLAFELLDDTWLAQRASYMQFNAVLKDVRGHVERALIAGAARVGKVSELRAHVGLRPDPVYF